MKKGLLFLIVITTFVLSPQLLNAQFIKGVIIGGFNTTQVDGDEVFGFKKWGFNAGVGAIIPFNKKWSISLENIYTENGAYQSRQFMDSLEDGSYNLKLNYVEVPIMIHYTDKERITIGAGFSYAALVKVDEWEHGHKTEASLDSETYSNGDFRMHIDLRFRIWKQIHGNVRYTYSITKIRHREYDPNPGFTDPWERNQFNNILSFRLVWIFNEKIRPKSDLGVE